MNPTLHGNTTKPNSENRKIRPCRFTALPVIHRHPNRNSHSGNAIAPTPRPSRLNPNARCAPAPPSQLRYPVRSMSADSATAR